MFKGNISDLLPHDAPMVLLDRYISSDDAELIAEVDISGKTMFCAPGKGVAAYVGVEYIAQAVSAFNGLTDWKSGGRIRPGFLLGSRKVDLLVDYFPIGSTLTVQVRMSFNDGEMVVFDGQIFQDDMMVIKARLNAYQPENPEEFIKSAQEQYG